METRGNKRRWQTTPSKKARVELDFGQNTPSPKRIKLSSTDSNSRPGDDLDSFTSKSFYGKREKRHFPHSPRRKKAADKVLAKMVMDENLDSENGQVLKGRSAVSTEDNTEFDFQSSDSAEDNNGKKKQVLKQKDRNVACKKNPLDVTKVKKTPRNVGKVQNNRANTTGKIESRCKELIEQQRTPMTTGKKFFKSRSPASADRQFGNVVIRKGFELKFCPRRLSLSSSKSDRSRAMSEKKKETRTKLVKSIKVSDQSFSADMFLVSDNEKLDGTQVISDKSDDASLRTQVFSQKSSIGQKYGRHCDTAEIDEDAVNNETTEKSNGNEASSAVKVSDSSFNTSVSNIPLDNAPDMDPAVESHRESTVYGFELKESNDDTSETISLIDAGSDSLFSSSGRITPSTVNSSREATPAKQSLSGSASVSPSGSVTCSTASVVSGDDTPKQVKLFPIFMKNNSPKSSSQIEKVRTQGLPGGRRSTESSPRTPTMRYMKGKNSTEQMIIDAGQKRYGATRCDGCGMVYTVPDEEVLHYKFHANLWSALKFPGWKKEHIVQEYRDTGSRVILVTEESPNYAIKKVEEINKIMGEELGFPSPGQTFRTNYKAFLYVSEEKTIEGCCVAEPVSEGYRVLLDSEVSSSPQKHPGHRPWCCSDEPEKAYIGISRIWVHSLARRKGVASRLLDCVRQWALYGIEIPRSKMAFSDPTPDGKLLATRYTGTPRFLVYKYQ